MALQVTYPGVYIQELPSGTQTIAGASTNITAFVGYLRRGPVDRPVQCLNFGDFQRSFGGLDAASDTSFQLYQFFLNGGTEAWVSRCVSSAAPPALASATLCGGPGGQPLAPLVTIAAANPGSWGADIYLAVDYTMAPPGQFDLTITLDPGNGTSETQVLQNTTLDPEQTNWIGNAVVFGEPDSLIAAPDKAGIPAVAAVPMASGTVLEILPLSAPVNGATFMLTLHPPGGGAPKTTTSAPIGTIAAPGDLIAAIQGAFHEAAVSLNQPSLAQVLVRLCRSPIASTGPTQAQWVQVRVPGCALAEWRIEIAASVSALFAQVQANAQAVRLSLPAQAGPDGLPPSGVDIAGDAVKRTGVCALDAMSAVNLIIVPDMPAMRAPDYLTAAIAALDYATQRRAFVILDLPNSVRTPADAATWATTLPARMGQGITSAATYFPQTAISDPLNSGQLRTIGASGTVAGVYAQTDLAHGVWKAPAGISAPLTGVQQLSYRMTDQENGTLNPIGVNALRSFPNYGDVIWGARTLASATSTSSDYEYIPVRRLALYIEQSLIQSLQWVVFEPNGPILWSQIRLAVNAFLHTLFQQGAFLGAATSEAYQCICDATTTTPDDIDNGIVNIQVMFAPVRPAEFVVITLQQMAGQGTS